jgi:multiple sugar transport system substrate-binding protein
MWGGSAISVLSSTKHPKEANEFAQWYLTNSGSLSIGVKEIGWFPSNKTAQASSDVNAPDPLFNNQVVDTTFEQVTIPTTWTWPPNLTTVNQLQGDDMNTAVTNKTSIVDVLAQLQTQVVNDLKSNGISVVSGG